MEEGDERLQEAEEQESSYDIPRPFLTLKQAAVILGKSLRTLERSILGKWGNKLPDGWTARKVQTEGGSEWRILPPPGFRLRQVDPEREDGAFEGETDQGQSIAHHAFGPERRSWPVERHSVDRPAIIIDRSEEVERLLRELLQAQKQVAEERRLRMEDLRLITQLQGSMRLLEVRATETASLKAELATANRELRELKEQYVELLSQPWWKRLFRRGSL